MNLHEWPLTFFTVFAQICVGAFIGLGAVQLGLRGKLDRQRLDRLTDPVLYAIGPLMIIGLILSIMHLGNPLNAPNAIRHIGSSWLAREILFGSAFAGLGFVFAVVEYKRWLTPAVRTVLAAVTALVGLGLVFVMSMVYMLPTQALWNHWSTPASFFVTTFLMGAALIATCYTIYPRLFKDAQARTYAHKITAYASLATSVFAVVAVMVAIAQSVRDSGGAEAEFALPTGWFIARILLLLVAAVLSGACFGAYLKRGDIAIARASVIQWLPAIACTLLLVAEIAGRFMFYGMQARIGI